MMQSGLTCLATSGITSGIGLAMAKIIGWLFKVVKISSVKALADETPINTSAPLQISAKLVSLET